MNYIAYFKIYRAIGRFIYPLYHKLKCHIYPGGECTKKCSRCPLILHFLCITCFSAYTACLYIRFTKKLPLWVWILATVQLFINEVREHE